MEYDNSIYIYMENYTIKMKFYIFWMEKDQSVLKRLKFHTQNYHTK